MVRDPSGVTAVPLTPVTAGRFVDWTGRIEPDREPAGLSFAFRVTDSGLPVYLVPSGTSSSVERLDRWSLDLTQPPIDVPSWATGAVIYQIFPDRFANGRPDNNPPGTVPWGTAPQPRQFQGGDLDGIVERLDHLERLGVDALYLNPIFTSPSNHKYDTIDYLSVDPAFGGNEALGRLVEACHRLHMRVILDASFNHCHPRFFAFADLLERGAASPYREWFEVYDWPPRIRVRPASAARRELDWISHWSEQSGLTVDEVAGEGRAIEPTYDAWYGVPTMPRLQLDHPEARAYVLDVARHWLRTYDIDGWRMDVARYVDPDFWPDFRRACREVKPDAYLLAEIMGDVSHWLRGDGFDATMNYTFRSIAIDFFATDSTDGDTFLDHCTRLYGRHALATTLANHNLIGSHDTPRFLTEAGDDLWRLSLATVFQLTYPGAPGIYYGDELGMSGGHDPGCRGAMPWHELGENAGIVDTISSLTALRRRTDALRIGEFRPVTAGPDTAVFERRHGKTRLLVGFNRGAESASLAVEEAGDTLWGEGTLQGGRLSIAARSAVIVAL